MKPDDFPEGFLEKLKTIMDAHEECECVDEELGCGDLWFSIHALILEYEDA